MRRSIGIALRLIIPVIACFGLGIASAPAQTYPVKPIRLIFGYTEGSAGWNGVLAPAGVPKEIIARVSGDVVAPAVHSTLKRSGSGAQWGQMRS